MKGIKSATALMAIIALVAVLVGGVYVMTTVGPFAKQQITQINQYGQPTTPGETQTTPAGPSIECSNTWSLYVGSHNDLNSSASEYQSANIRLISDTSKIVSAGTSTPGAQAYVVGATQADTKLNLTAISPYMFLDG